MISANITASLYLVTGILFIMALRGLSSPETSRTGNFLGILGMVFGLFPSLVDVTIFQPLLAELLPNPSIKSVKLWHGFNTVLYLSILTIVLGITLLYFLKQYWYRYQNFDLKVLTIFQYDLI